MVNNTSEVINCSRCNSENVVRAGMSRTKQRYLCKNCGKYFTPASTESERIVHTRNKAAILLYLAGAQIKDMEKLFGVSYPTIVKWIAPAQELVENNKDFNNVRRTQDSKIKIVSSPKEIPTKPRKNWLLIELGDDHFNGKSVSLSSDE